LSVAWKVIDPRSWSWVAFPLLVIVVWEIGARHFDPLLVPSPAASAQALMELARDGALWRELAISLRRVVVGVLIGAGCGIPFGILVARSETADRLFGEAIPAVSATSSAVWAVLGLLWFGLSDGATVFVVAMTAAPLLAVNARDAVHSVDRQLVELAQSMGFGTAAVVGKIVLPEIAPALYSGCRLALGFGWRVGLVSEALGSASGVGFQLKQAVDLMHTADVFAWSVAVIVVMILIEIVAFRPLEAWSFRWRKPLRASHAEG
jgi:NitT/TauT family transport system permease protein